MSDYSKFRGRCKELSEQLVEADPTLILIRGYYHDPSWGKQAHWWCQCQDGTIIDPTKDQFPSKGAGLYEPFDGYCECAECGKEIKEEDAVPCGNYPTCSTACAMRLVGL